MDTDPFQLIKKQRSERQEQDLVQYLKKNIFKSLLTPLPVSDLIAHFKLFEWSSSSYLFEEGDKIQDFYFVLEGSVNLYKKSFSKSTEKRKVQMEIDQNRVSPSIVGQSFITQNIFRTHTAITDDNSITKGFSLKKSIFDQYASDFFKQYKNLKTYICQYIDVQTEQRFNIDLYEHLQFKTSHYGQQIQPQNEVFIIYEGECLMSFQQKFQPNIVRRVQRGTIPYMKQACKIERRQPLLKLCQNQCFGMERIVSNSESRMQETFSKNLLKDSKFRYVVSSQKLVYLAIKHSSINLFPPKLRTKLKKYHQSYQQRLGSNIYFKKQYSVQQENNSPAIWKKSLSLSRVNSNQKDEYKLNSLIKPKFTQINLHQSKLKSYSKNSPICVSNTSSQVNSLQNSQIYIDDEKDKLPQIGFQMNKQKSRTAKRSEMQDLRKKYCLGYNLKGKFENSSSLCKNSRKENSINEPRGYFEVNMPKKKVAGQKTTKNQSKNPKQQRRREWIQYLRLPKLAAANSIYTQIVPKRIR